MQNLLGFYGEQVSVEIEGVTYTSKAVIDAEEPIAEWQIFKGAVVREINGMMQKKKLAKPPTFQELKVEMMALITYANIFPKIFKLLDILLTLPVGTETVERSFSQMKMVKTRLRSKLNDVNLARLMRIAIEGPQLSTTDFSNILDIFKENIILPFCCSYV